MGGRHFSFLKFCFVSPARYERRGTTFTMSQPRWSLQRLISAPARMPDCTVSDSYIEDYRCSRQHINRRVFDTNMEAKYYLVRPESA